MGPVTTFDVKRSKQLADALPRQVAGDGSPCGACSIRHLSICAVLRPDELSEMDAIATAVELAPGDPLFDEEEPADYFFNVTAGTMKIYKLLADGRRQVTGFLGAGDFLGLAHEATYAYSAEAVTAASLCRFPRRKLEALLQRFPKLETRLLGVAGHELAAAQEQMVLLGRKTAREKIASFLLALERQAARREQPDGPVNVPMSRADIGDYLGLTTETVSRTFTQLKGAGVIRLLQGGRVELLDRAALARLAEGQ
ncbi:MAG: Crp/Fnr family transcriptional regulator [Kiloniellales bacterium]